MRSRREGDGRGRRLRRVVLGAAWAVLLGFLSGSGTLGEAPEPFGEADLDNDPEERELILGEGERAAGFYEAPDDDGDGDFDRLIVGLGGGARLVGWRDFDGLPPEAEVYVSDPTIPTGRVNAVDVDNDEDADLLWVGTRGRDLDGDGTVEPEENGRVVGSGDLDGDGNPEIVVLDLTRELGDYLVESFGINRSASDPREVLWVGVLDERGRTPIATIDAILDADRDGDDDVLVKDLRPAEASGFGLEVLDLDGDGDGDIWIRRD